MLIGIFGNDFEGSSMGCLKTYFLTSNLYLDYRNNMKVYSNYALKFPYEKIKSFQQLVDECLSMKKVSIGIDEFHIYFDAYSHISKKTGHNEWLFKEFARQTRKRGIKLYMTAQSYWDIHRSLRRILTKVYFVNKLNLDGSVCKKEFCFEKHNLEVIEGLDGNTNKIIYPVVTEIFDLYDSDEVLNIE